MRWQEGYKMEAKNCNVQISGQFVLSASLETRAAGQCSLPRGWVSDNKPAALTEPVVLNPMPLLLRHKNGREERIGWLPTEQGSLLHRDDPVFVKMIDQTDLSDSTGLEGLLRFVSYDLESLAIGRVHWRIRRKILARLVTEPDLRAAYAREVLGGVGVEHALEPRHLLPFINYKWSERTLQYDVSAILGRHGSATIPPDSSIQRDSEKDTGQSTYPEPLMDQDTISADSPDSENDDREKKFEALYNQLREVEGRLPEYATTIGQLEKCPKNDKGYAQDRLLLWSLQQLEDDIRKNPQTIAGRIYDFLRSRINVD